MNETASRVRKGRKYSQVLEGARQVFLSDGFEGASVDDIARAAGVSKATLYSYFPDKRLLFMEVATNQCDLQADQAVQAIDCSLPVSSILRETATQMLDFMMSDIGQRIFRICVAESDRFPNIGSQFYNSGPDRIHGLLVEILTNGIERGELKIDDLPLAAGQFIELCKADWWSKLVFGIQQDFTEVEINRVVDGAVAMFMARYST